MHAEFAERRARVLAAMRAGAGGVLVLPSAPLAIRNNDVEHEYRQDSDLFYLTGFDEPESLLVLSSQSEQPFTLFVRPRDPEREVWDGARAGVEGARAQYGADVALTISELEAKLPELLSDHDRLYYRLGRDRRMDELMLTAIDRARARGRLGKTWPTEIVDPATIIHEHRLKKSKLELDAMRRALAITQEAHLRAMAETRPGKYEYEIEAVLRERFRAGGAERCAYAPIVGGGVNATVLHYHKNDKRLEAGELLLIDAGCEYDYYAADITRTFPVDGKFTREQRAVYEIVLEAQLASIAATRPGATLDQVHQAGVEVIADGLVKLGIIEGPVAAAIEEQRYKPYFMHRTSHWLGMDVHDVGRYHLDGKPRTLEAGMVITIEPGIYIAAGSAAPQPYRGIGVRIEDDVLIAEEGSSVLSAGIPKTVEDVERACRV